ncbi:hypothetical protein CEXT_49381 [Caerostris extrusa]|uniref:Uncharacterized protein n=1 Tax=Caerostris extrusa TaxID=172846 RepID=A0AAV4XQV9_CAEEX|nr:hypothetical protein CEXT_49381 [Caerostris extrusa]
MTYSDRIYSLGSIHVGWRPERKKRKRNSSTYRKKKDKTSAGGVPLGKTLLPLLVTSSLTHQVSVLQVRGVVSSRAFLFPGPIPVLREEQMVPFSLDPSHLYHMEQRRGMPRDDESSKGSVQQLEEERRGCWCHCFAFRYKTRANLASVHANTITELFTAEVKTEGERFNSFTDPFNAAKCANRRGIVEQDAKGFRSFIPVFFMLNNSPFLFLSCPFFLYVHIYLSHPTPNHLEMLLSEPPFVSFRFQKRLQLPNDEMHTLY